MCSELYTTNNYLPMLAVMLSCICMQNAYALVNISTISYTLNMSKNASSASLIKIYR